jgi:hypothetical protein
MWETSKLCLLARALSSETLLVEEAGGCSLFFLPVHHPEFTLSGLRREDSQQEDSICRIHVKHEENEETQSLPLHDVGMLDPSSHTPSTTPAYAIHHIRHHPCACLLRHQHDAFSTSLTPTRLELNLPVLA